MGSIELLKTVYTVLTEMKRVDLAEEIMSHREEMMSLREEKLRLVEENKSLKEQLQLEANIVFENGVCWIENDEMTTDNAKTPICPQCWQVDKIVNRLPIRQSGDRSGIRCTECKQFFQVK